MNGGGGVGGGGRPLHSRAPSTSSMGSLVRGMSEVTDCGDDVFPRILESTLGRCEASSPTFTLGLDSVAFIMHPIRGNDQPTPGQLLDGYHQKTRPTY